MSRSHGETTGAMAKGWFKRAQRRGGGDVRIKKKCPLGCGNGPRLLHRKRVGEIACVERGAMEKGVGV